jgi:hypothetical protein
VIGVTFWIGAHIVPLPAAAQVVSGRLIDDATGEAVAGAQIALLGDDDRPAAGAISSDDGSFLLRADDHGWYRLRGQRLGYATTTSAPLDLVENDSLEVEFRLAAEAIPLAPLTVVARGRRPEARNPRLERWDYYERKEYYGDKSGFGRFLEGEDLRSTAFSVTDLVRQVPGLRHVSQGGRKVAVTDRRGRACALFIDGVHVEGGLGHGWVNPTSVIAIEVYSGMVVPGPFLLARKPTCVVAVWTGIAT